MKPNMNKLRTRLAVRHIRSIKQGIRALVDIDQILDAWEQQHNPAIQEPTKITGAQGREWARFHINIQNTEILNNALARIYADGWVLGIDTGAYWVARKLDIKKQVTVTQADLKRAMRTNWSKWTPGNRAAAELVRQPDGLKRLLASRGVKIQGMSRTTLNQIGTALADGLNRGATRREIADDLSYILGSDARALTIAGTEMGSAVVAANMELYQNSGVEMLEWLLAEYENNCEDCLDNYDQSPIPIGEEWRNGPPLVHPNCGCDVAPYVVDTSLWADVYGNEE